MEFDVMEIAQIILTAEERSGFCLPHACRNMGCGLRGLC